MPRSVESTVIERYHRFLFRFGRRLPIPDFEARTLLADSRDRAIVTSKLTAALRLMAEHTPLRLQYLQRDLPRLWVFVSQYEGQSLESVGICLLNLDTVLADGTSADRIALTLVHEGMHARLDRAGVKYGWDTRARIERLCIRAELVFASRLGNPTELIRDGERRLHHADDFWSAEAQRLRNRAALAELGLPGRLGYTLGRVLGWGRDGAT